MRGTELNRMSRAAGGPQDMGRPPSGVTQESL